MPLFWDRPIQLLIDGAKPTQNEASSLINASPIPKWHANRTPPEREEKQVAPTAVRLHPNLAEHYASLVSSLRDHLNNADYKDEAATVLRGLIDNIIIQPTEEGIEIDIAGNLASMLTLSLETQKAPRRERCDSTILLVAGTGLNFARTTIRASRD